MWKSRPRQCPGKQPAGRVALAGQQSGCGGAWGAAGLHPPSCGAGGLCGAALEQCDAFSRLLGVRDMHMLALSAGSVVGSAGGLPLPVAR